MLARALVAEARRRGWPTLALRRADADVRDGAAVDRWVDSFAPQVIFNCAAFTAVDVCEERRADADAINGEAVGNLARAAARRGARLVHVSTDYVFDGKGQAPYDEAHATAPLSAYGLSKLLGEERALASPLSLVVRTSWLFGEGGPNFVATMVRLLRA